MQGDYSYYHYPPNPNPNPSPNPNPNPPPHDPNPIPYASAPPCSTNYTPTSDYTSYSQSYPPYHENPDPPPATAPTAPSYASPPTLTPNSLSSFPPFESHTPHAPYQPPQQPQQNYYSPPTTANTSHTPYDQVLAPPSYAPSSIPDQMPNSTPNLGYSSMYGSSAPYNPPSYESAYDKSAKFDRGGGSGYFESRYGGNSSGRRSDYGVNSDLYRKKSESLHGDGVYAYEGGKVEPYGARGTAPKSSTWSSNSVTFDDYGRPIGLGSGKESSGSVSSQPKIVRAAPKVESQQDVKGGVQKFRVKLLAESGGQSTVDVLCQIGLDGIRMLDPSTSRTLRIYPLETITRCEVSNPSTLAFWSKSSVDIEPRRIRLQSNSYTTNTLLDIVTAATVQLKEMGGRIRPPDSSKMIEQPSEKKKGFADWMNFIKPANEEKDHWVPDEAVSKCTACATDFGAFVRKHHCRNCGDIFCDKCTSGRITLTADDNAQPVRVCDRCLAEVTQRLSNVKEAANRPAVQSHEDLAKKLQEEMERNRRGSSGSQSDVSGRRMREVACPICTVHLQVQVPTSGSETIECGVCQNPFLVSAH